MNCLLYDLKIQVTIEQQQKSNNTILKFVETFGKFLLKMIIFLFSFCFFLQLKEDILYQIIFEINR